MKKLPKNSPLLSSKLYAITNNDRFTFILFVTLFLFPIKTGLACYYVPEPYTFNFINRSIIGETNGQDLILEKLHEVYFYTDRIENAAANNIKEWQ